jgi:hypothetical protein
VIVLSQSIDVTFNAISGNGKHIEAGGSDKVFGLNVGINGLSARATGDSKMRAKARYFLVAAKRRSNYSARACKESSSYLGVRNSMSKKGWNGPLAVRRTAPIAARVGFWKHTAIIGVG